MLYKFVLLSFISFALVNGVRTCGMTLPARSPSTSNTSTWTAPSSSGGAEVTSLTPAFHFAIMAPTSCRTTSGWSASRGCDETSLLATAAVTSHVGAEVVLPAVIMSRDAVCDDQSTLVFPVSLAACYVQHSWMLQHFWQTLQFINYKPMTVCGHLEHSIIRYAFWWVIGPLECKGSYSATSNEVGTLAVNGWAVTFGTARRGRGGQQPYCRTCI